MRSGCMVVLAAWLSLAASGCETDEGGDDSAKDADDDGGGRSKKKSKKKTDDGDRAGDGCDKDTDCKGDRVCQDGTCKEPAPKQAALPPPAPPPPPAAPAPAPPPAAPVPLPPPLQPPPGGGSNGPAQPPTLAFTPVAAEVWTPRLGPKMLAGSKVVHTVFEGPFGPSPKSLFAVTERPDKSYYVYVMGDDDKPWPAGPLAEKGTWLADKITAVAFFDADKNGTTDALVMAQYKGRAGDRRNRNALLKWTNLGMRRLLNLEPKIEFMDSAEAIKRKLAE